MMIATDKLKNALESKGVKLQCYACNNGKLSANTDLSANAPVDKNAELKIGQQIITPVVQMICGKCGYVMEFNPFVLGLIEE